MWSSRNQLYLFRSNQSGSSFGPMTQSKVKVASFPKITMVSKATSSKNPRISLELLGPMKNNIEDEEDNHKKDDDDHEQAENDEEENHKGEKKKTMKKKKMMMIMNKQKMMKKKIIRGRRRRL